MKKIISISLVTLSLRGYSQLIMREEMKEPMEGICDHNQVYALYGGFKGQVEPKCSVSKEEMQKLLNEKIVFLKANPKFKGKGMVSVYINCKGETLKWRISVKTKSDELDKEILEIFKTFNTWTVGTLDGKNVDASELISYKIKKGILTIE